MIPNSKILVVDDEPIVAKLVSAMLEKHDYQVEVAENGADALDMIAADLPDLILLDIEMPQVNGYEVLMRVKTNDLTTKIPVVVLTGAHIERASRLRCLDLGADDFITKPADEEEILVRVRNHIRLKKLHEIEIEKERIKGALQMAQAASTDMNVLLDQILNTASLLLNDRDDNKLQEKYFEQFKDDLQQFVELSERLSALTRLGN